MNISKVTICLLYITTFWHSALMWDKEFILPYILAISKILKVQEFVWFVSEHLDTKSSESFQDFFNTIHRNATATQMVFTKNYAARITDTTSKSNYLGVVMTNGVKDPVMSLHNDVLLQRHTRINIIILAKPLHDLAEARPLLRLLNLRNFINSILYVEYLNGTSDLLGVRRYPYFAIESRKNILEDLKEAMGRTKVSSLDCQGFDFHTPLRFDLPVVFPYTNKQNKTEMLGISFKILQLFIQKINATIAAFEMPPDRFGGLVVNMKEVLKLIRARKILITAHAYALFRPDNELAISKPILLVKWCLMVPIRNTLSPFYYPTIPYERPVWIMIFVSYLALVITDGCWLWWHSQKNPQQKCNLRLQIQASLTNSICHLLFVATWKHIKSPSIVRFLLYASVFFHAFFLSVGYCSLLGSFLTVTLFKEEISNMADFIKANISAMIIDYELEFLLNQKLNLSEEFLKLIKPVDSATFYWHQSSLNQSYAYFVCEHQWTFLRQQQIYLKPGLFKLTNICFGTYHFGFPMELDSPLQKGFGIFIERLKASGLVHQLIKISFSQAVQAGYVQYLKPTLNYQAAGFSHVSMVFLMLIIVSGISFIVFIAECFYYRWSSKCKTAKLINKNSVC